METGRGQREESADSILREVHADRQVQKLTDVMEKHGADAGALGGLILEYAEYSQAVQEGFVMDDDVLTEEVAEVKKAYETAVISTQASMVGDMKGYVGAVGEDRFWNEIYPSKLRHQILFGDWRLVEIKNFADSDNPSAKDWEVTVYALQNEALTKANVEVMDASLMKATVAQALAYMNEYNGVKYTYK